MINSEKEKLIGIIEEFYPLTDRIDMLANKILSSGYVHKEDVLRCLPKEKEPEKQEPDTITYQCFGEYNQALKEVRQAIENLGETK